MGIDPDKFWYYTWKEVLLLGESWHINHNLEWERLRYLAATVYCARAEKRSQLVKPSQLFKLPQDRYLKKEVKPSTRGDYERMLERIKRAEQIGFSNPSDQFKDLNEVKPKK